MFYLRIVSKGQVQNICLGNCYRKVTSEFKCEEDWVRIPREQHPSCAMFIYSEYNEPPIPIFSNNDYYIVTENGNTYERLYTKDIYVPRKVKFN
jgi:hypothetical protein